MLKTKITLISLLALFFAMMALNSNALIDSCASNNPPNVSDGRFDDGLIKLNVTGKWSGAGANLTNVTWVLTDGVNFANYTNGTVNGSAGVGVSTGDFTFTITASDVLADGNYTIFAICQNDTIPHVTTSDTTLNTTKIEYTIDSTNPSVTIQQPNQGQTVSAKGTGKVTIEFTPSDTNLGNATYYINNFRQTSSVSATNNPNFTSGKRTQFTKFFGSNNNSITLKVEITDLAGRKTNSSTITFNVFREGAAEPAIVFITPSGERISTPATPKGKAITKPLTFGNIGNTGNLLSNPFVWGGAIIAAVGLFIWWQNRKR